MELRVLRYFLAVAREGSITGAANYLHLTQPTLSRQIRDLEEELGRPLLHRENHRITLTPEGMLLRRRAEEIVAMADKTQAEFSALEHSVSGDIYLGGGETQAIRPIAKILKQLREDYPGIRYHLFSGNAADVTERLDKGLLDFGILIQPADLSKYNHLTLPAKDLWGVLLPKSDPLAAKEAFQKEDLRNLPLICSRQAIAPNHAGNEFADWFGEDFQSLNIVTTFNLVYNAAMLVEAGVGYAITIDKLADTGPDSPSASGLCPPGWNRDWTSSGKSTRSFPRRPSFFWNGWKTPFPQSNENCLDRTRHSQGVFILSGTFRLFHRPAVHPKCQNGGKQFGDPKGVPHPFRSKGQAQQPSSRKDYHQIPGQRDSQAGQPLSQSFQSTGRGHRHSGNHKPGADNPQGPAPISMVSGF